MVFGKESGFWMDLVQFIEEVDFSVEDVFGKNVSFRRSLCTVDNNQLDMRVC